MEPVLPNEGTGFLLIQAQGLGEMKWPKCEYENREGAKFCNECGNKLEVACPECGKINRLGSKFCDECGHNLGLPSERSARELSLDEKLAKIQRYLPKGLTEKILAKGFSQGFVTGVCTVSRKRLRYNRVF